MGKSSKQTVGYKYFAGLQVALGNCIEQILNINPDNRGWIFTTLAEKMQLKAGDTSMRVNKPDLFGGDKQEGGWVGMIEIHTGRPEYIRQNAYLAEHDSELVSSFPYLSYVVFKGYTIDKGFQLVSMSGMLKEVLYWPKRTRIKDDGSEQWYKIRPSDSAVVCEIGTFKEVPSTGMPVNLIPNFNYTFQGYVGTATYTKEQGIFGNAGSSGYGGVENPSIEESIYFKPIAEELNLFDLVEITASAWGSVRDISIELIGARFVYFYEIDTTGGENEEKTVSIKVVCEKGGEFPYLKLTGTGTISTSGGYNNYYWQFSSRTIPIDNYGYYNESNGLDINPIHKIREIITDDTAMNKPEAMINDVNFMEAANRIWDEHLGVSGSFTEKSCKEAIDELLYHIEAGIRVNRQTGLYEIVLFRDDLLDLDNAQLFDKSNIKTFSIETANIDDVINSVNVNYYDRENIKDSSFSLDELGSILSNQSNAETLDFPYFMNRRNAELVGNWKLKQLSTPTRKGTFTTGKYDARKINRYDVVKLTWHNQNMIEVPIRIIKIGLGDGIDNTVTLDWVEVIPYSSINYPSINVDQSTSVVLSPQPNESIVFEMPYFEAVQRFGQTQVDNELSNNPDLGYLMVATKRPQNNSINALLFTDNGTGYQQASIVDYCPVVQLDQNISYLDTSFAVKNVASISQAEVGTLILCDDELMVYQSYDANTKILTVKRAALDTVPKPHLQDAVFYFYDSFSAFDSEQYVLSEVINAKVLTTTPSGVQGLGDATALSVEMNARQIRPYPPANVKINGEYWYAEYDSSVVLTWVHRNRLQQTGGSILGFYDGGVSAENGITYILKVYEIDENGVELEYFNQNIGLVDNYNLDLSTLLSTTKSIRVELSSIRDGYESFQTIKHVMYPSFNPPFNLEASYIDSEMVLTWEYIE